MPSGTRWAIRRKMKTALNELVKAQEKLVEIGQLYKPNHQKHYDKYCVFVNYLESLKTALEEAAKEI